MLCILVGMKDKSVTYLDILAINSIASVNLEKIPLPPAQSLTAEQVERLWAAVEYLVG